MISVSETRFNRFFSQVSRGRLICEFNSNIQVTSLRQLASSSWIIEKHSKHFNWKRVFSNTKIILATSAVLATSELDTSENKNITKELLDVLNRRNFGEIIALLEKKGSEFLREYPISEGCNDPFKKSLLENVLEFINYDLPEHILRYLFNYVAVCSEQVKKNNLNLLHILVRNCRESDSPVFNLIKKEIKENPELLRQRANFDTPDNMTPIEMATRVWRNMNLSKCLIYKHQQYFGFAEENKQKLMQHVKALNYASSKDREMLLRLCEGLGEKKETHLRSGSDLRRELSTRVMTHSTEYKGYIRHLFNKVLAELETIMKEKMDASFKKKAFETIFPKYETIIRENFIEEFFTWLCEGFTDEEVEEMLDEYEYNDGQIDTEFHQVSINANRIFSNEARLTNVILKNQDCQNKMLQELFLLHEGKEIGL